MYKKIARSAQQLKDWWRDRAHSTWKKMSAGAAQIGKVMTWAHKDQWRRKDKHQNSHDNHPHKSHRDR
jgi:hypothetical protein